MTDKIKKAYIRFMNEVINDLGWEDIDIFALDYELDDEAVTELLNLPLKVVEEEA